MSRPPLQCQVGQHGGKHGSFCALTKRRHLGVTAVSYHCSGASQAANQQTDSIATLETGFVATRLDDNRTLADYGVQAESTLRLSQRIDHQRDAEMNRCMPTLMHVCAALQLHEDFAVELLLHFSCSASQATHRFPSCAGPPDNRILYLARNNARRALCPKHA